MNVTISEVKVWSYELPLSLPIHVNGQTLTVRKGFLLGLIDHTGAIHYGEVAPLPGVHKESLQSCWAELKLVAEQLKGYCLCLELFDWELTFLGLLDKTIVLSPATMFGVEQALLNLAIRHGRLPTLGDKALDFASIAVPCAGLLNLSAERAPEAVSAAFDILVRNGARSIKFKLGRLPLQDEIAQLVDLAAKAPPNVQFRLDANRALSPAAFAELRTGLSAIPIEFFEEPLCEGALSEHEARRTPFPLALDEWFWDRDVSHDTEAGFYILKPARLGGISRTVRWINKAQANGAKAILSSCYESGLSMLTYAYLCAYFHLDGCDMGLGTYAFLAQDVLQHPLHLAAGTSYVPLAHGDVALDHRRLLAQNLE